MWQYHAPLHIFPRKSSLLGFTLSDKRTPLPPPEIYAQNLSSQYLVVRGSKNSKGGGRIIQISQKETLF